MTAAHPSHDAPLDGGLVSVVLATNRGGRFLTEAIGSVAAQTYPSIEFVIVDDGAPDPEALTSAAALFPGGRVVRVEDGGGVSAARNAGVAASAGEFIAFLDDDDRWRPERVAACVARLRADDAVVAVYCGMQTIDAEGRVLAPADQTEVSGRADVISRKTGIILPNLMVRRAAFDAAGGFDTSLRLAEDLDLTLKLADHGRFAFEPQTLVDYRAHDSNTTRRHRELVAAIDHVLRRHRDACDDPSLREPFEESLAKNDRFAWWGAARAARANLRGKRVFAAIGDCLWALRVAPRGLTSAIGRRLRT